jgi:transcriptional regulator with XRE-family HTH domain
MTKPKAQIIRAKKLAVLIRDARQAAGKTKLETAAAISVSQHVYDQYETGEISPSLPELEALAFYLDIPLDHFWGSYSRSEHPETVDTEKLERIILLRQRMIGALVRKTRMEAGLGVKSVAERAGISEEQLEKYELGQEPLPVPTLENLIGVIGKPLQHFFDQKTMVGHRSVEQQAIKQFLQLTPDLQAFVCKPINRPYIELAIRLSEMSVDKLRAVAEGLLEITY